jgi:hypothetical protein
MEFSGGFGAQRCTLTLEGSFHSNTITKTRSSLIGYVTEGRTTRCGSFGATVLRERLPWHLQYESFSGVLPNITSAAFKILGFQFKIREPTFGIECLYRERAPEGEGGPLFMTLTREGGGIVTSASLSGELWSDDCGRSGLFGGTSSTFGTPPPAPPPPTTITLRLI